MDSNKALDLLLEIKEDLAEVRSDTRVIRQDNKQLKDQVAHLEKRVKGLESDAWKAKGAIAFVLATSAIAAFVKMLN